MWIEWCWLVFWPLVISVLKIVLQALKDMGVKFEGWMLSLLKCLILKYKFLSLGLSPSPVADVEKTSHVLGKV